MRKSLLETLLPFLSTIYLVTAGGSAQAGQSTLSVSEAYHEAFVQALQAAQVDQSTWNRFYMVPSTPTDLGSTDPSKHNAAVLNLFDGIPNDNEDKYKGERSGSFSTEWSIFQYGVQYPVDNSTAAATLADETQQHAIDSRSEVSNEGILIIFFFPPTKKTIFYFSFIRYFYVLLFMFKFLIFSFLFFR